MEAMLHQLSAHWRIEGRVVMESSVMTHGVGNVGDFILSNKCLPF